MQLATYVRLFADAQGESHFEDLQMDLAPVDFAPPAAPVNLGQFLPTAHSYYVGVPVGWHDEVTHPSPRRQSYSNLPGEYEVTASDGEVRRFGAGSVLLLEDTTGKGHSTHFTGDEDVLML